jgi:hypothetical protein
MNPFAMLLEFFISPDTVNRITSQLLVSVDLFPPDIAHGPAGTISPHFRVATQITSSVILTPDLVLGGGALHRVIFSLPLFMLQVQRSSHHSL